jgi:hypothetical protein
MDFDQLINNWHSKASDDDYFSKFVFEYLAFIAFLRKVLFKDATMDRDAIQRLKRDVGIKKLYLESINNDPELKQVWQNIKAELEKNPLGNVSGNGEGTEEIKWWNCSHSCLERRTRHEQPRLSGIIHDLGDWENMVEYLYSIRNNFFHGGKNPQDPRDQLLVKNGFMALSFLVDILLHMNDK